MSQVKAVFTIIMLLLVGALLFGCGSASENKDNPRTSDGDQHPVGWLPAGHKALAVADVNSCKDCHGEDLAGGISRISCTLCHIGSPSSVHPTDWQGATVLKHGWYVVQNGTNACSNINCHGANLEGVALSGPACGSCHATVPSTATCTACHAFPPTSGAHSQHLANRSVDCSACHEGNHAFTTGTSHSGPVLTDFRAIFSAKSGTASYDAASKTCAQISCHGGQTTPSWATGFLDVETQCGSCHTLGITQYNSFNSGMHNLHAVAPGIQPLPKLSCIACHDTTKLSVSHFTSLLSAVMEGPAAQTLNGPLNYNGTTCNPGCHDTKIW